VAPSAKPPPEPHQGGLTRRQVVLGGGSLLGGLALVAGGRQLVHGLVTHTDAVNSFGSVPPATQPQFHSRPDLRIPTLAVDVNKGGTAPGLIFIAPYGAPHGQAGAIITDSSGAAIWEQASDLEITNFGPQTYRDKPVLAWWQGKIEYGHGVGSYVIANDSYEPIAQIQAGHGLQGDLHEFLLTSRGTALLTSYIITHADLRSVGGSQDGTIQDAVFQELDIASGRVLLEWHSLDHIAPSESYWPVGNLWDYVHLNSIDVDVEDENLIVSSRNTHTIYKIDRDSGEIIWRLGGKQSNFAMGDGASFAWQHDARSHPGGTITIFDNEGSPFAAGAQSRAIVLTVDEQRKTARLQREYRHPLALASSSKGSVQLLPNGNVFVGWGAEPFVSEFSPSGELLFDARLGASYIFYRAFRSPWTAAGPGQPRIAAMRNSRATDVWASWNGDTRVRHWLVLGGGPNGALSRLGVHPREGFETAVRIDALPQRVAVYALDAHGRVLGKSATLSL
jgi:Arylsulfotransferase (ASST)